MVAATLLVMVAGCGDGDTTPGDGAAPTSGTPTSPAPGTPPSPSGPEPPPPPTAPQPLPTLVGTRWTVDTVIWRGEAITVPAGPDNSAWLVVHGETFYAFTGCGEVEGRVRITADELIFSDVVHAIPIHCPEGFARADEVMREVLSTRTRYAAEDGRLRLDHSDSLGLRLYAGGPSAPDR